MDAKEKEIYLRKAISIKIDSNTTLDSFNREDFIAHYKKFPERLYKYRVVSKYNIDSLINSYIFLSPADKMDDQFECSANIDLDTIYDSDKDKLISTFVDELVDMISDYPSTMSKEETRKLAHSFANTNQSVSEGDIRKIIVNNQEFKNISDDKNAIDAWVKLMTTVWKSDSVQQSLRNLFVGAMEAKHEEGIGALAESNTSQVMWEMYANHYRGYCVEYDFRSSPDCLINTFPVIYGDKRKTELVRILVALTIEAIVYQISKQKIDSFDRALDYIRLFVTKYEEWSFQNEWRILGTKNFKFKVPKPKAIYIGKKCSKKDKRLLFEIARKQKIRLYQQKDNMTNLTLDFERLL